MKIYFIVDLMIFIRYLMLIFFYINLVELIIFLTLQKNEIKISVS